MATKVPTKKGSAGPPRRTITEAASNAAPPGEAQLNARQERIRRKRRRGPELPSAEGTAALREAVRRQVDPTECDEEEGEN